MTIEFDPTGLIHSARERAIVRLPEGLPAQEETVLLILLATALEEGIRTEAHLNEKLMQADIEKVELESNQNTMTEVWQAEINAYQDRENKSIATIDALTKVVAKGRTKIQRLEAKLAELVYADTAPKAEGF